MSRLKAKHERFCRNFVEYANATLAAKTAGYAPASARNAGYRLLRHPRIVARITELQGEMAEAHCRNLDILLRLWTEERVTLKADEFNLREAVMVPRTSQRPRPPILIGGYVDAVLKRAGTMGDGWLTYFYTPESFTKSWDKVKAFARGAGRDPAKLTATNQLANWGPRYRTNDAR